MGGLGFTLGGCNAAGSQGALGAPIALRVGGGGAVLGGPWIHLCGCRAALQGWGSIGLGL